MKTFLLTFALMFISPAVFASSSCEQAHQAALNKCRAYEGQMSASDLESLSFETRIRAAQTEQRRNLYLGRSCAKAQETCARTCASSIQSALTQGGNWGLFSDLTSDCREGVVAKHRRQIAKRYRDFKSMTFPEVVSSERKGPMSFDALGAN